MPTRRAILATLPPPAIGATLGPGPGARRAAAQAVRPPVVVELFTSQSCSSCPPADAFLAELARDQAARAILPLSFHVTYWDRLGWKDRFSLPEATERQRRYAASLHSVTVYTPQVVVQGLTHHVGSDRSAVLGAVERARAVAARGPTMTLARAPGGLVLDVGAGAGAGQVWLVGFDTRQVTPVRGGENAGRTLAQAQVVRSLREAGGWGGAAQRLDLPAPASGERAAVLLQGPDGAILAAAVLPGA